MFHEGKIGPTASLDSMLPNPDLFALGALADLAGEFTIVAGKAYISYPEGDSSRTESPASTNAAATLMVAADVPAWRSFHIDNGFRFEALDGEIARLATAAGMSLDRPFPFLLEGEFEDLQWHVIDGSRLMAGAGSHEDHQAAAAKASLKRAAAILIGFYSQSDQGVFTHMGSNTHIHCVLKAPLATGHVDHVVVPKGAILKLPRMST